MGFCGEFTDSTMAVSSKDTSSRVSRGDTHLTHTGHIQARPVGLNIIPWQRSSPQQGFVLGAVPFSFAAILGTPLHPPEPFLLSGSSPHQTLGISCPLAAVCAVGLHGACIPHSKWYGHHSDRSHANMKMSFLSWMIGPSRKKGSSTGRQEMRAVWCMINLYP